MSFQVERGRSESKARCHIREHPQRLLGSAFEFNLQSSLGLRWMLTDKWALAFEGGYRHISNANTASRNTRKTGA